MRVLMTREEFETYIRPRKDFNPVVTATEFNKRNTRDFLRVFLFYSLIV